MRRGIAWSDIFRSGLHEKVTAAAGEPLSKFNHMELFHTAASGRRRRVSRPCHEARLDKSTDDASHGDNFVFSRQLPVSRGGYTLRSEPGWAKKKPANEQQETVGCNFEE
jgi:hypothetical protein